MSAIVAQCLNAEIDILLICHAGPNIERAFHLIRELTGTSEETAHKSERSLERIRKTKERFLP